MELFEDDTLFDDIQLVDFYRYTDVPLEEMYRYLGEHAPWTRPSDTGRSTNCLINDVGIYIHKKVRGYHNYALPYSWDVRVGHKTRSEAIDELNDDIDRNRVHQILAEIGYDESEKGQQLVAYVVPQQPIHSSDLTQFLMQRLPDYMLPTQFVMLEQLPLTQNGKVDREALPQPEVGRARVETAFVAPQTNVELELVKIWTTVLGIPEVGVHDNFFELGGDSISTIQVMMHISRTFQTDLLPTELFDSPTVAALAVQIEDRIIAEIENLTDEEAERLLSKLN